MKIISNEEYNELCESSRKSLLYQVKLDKINNLVDKYRKYNANIFTVIRDINEVLKY